MLFWPFGPSFLSLWPFGPWFHFGFLSLHVLSFSPFGPWFPFILAFWALISFHFGFLGLDFRIFGLLRGWPVGSPPHKLPKTARCLKKYTSRLSAPGPGSILQFFAFDVGHKATEVKKQKKYFIMLWVLLRGWVIPMENQLLVGGLSSKPLWTLKHRP